MNMRVGQDWQEVVLTKRPPGGAGASDSKNVRAAMQRGEEVDTIKKHAGGSNKAGTTGTGLSARKLEEETEDFNVERVTTDLKKQILQARLAKSLTQAQLAQLINEKPQVVQEYESGKAVPNPQILSKLSRALGVALSKKGGPAKEPAKAAPKRR